MKGIIINTETGDLKVANGTMVVDHCEQDVAERVLVSARGEMKELPFVGGEVKLMHGAGTDPLWAGRIKDMLRAAGIDCRSVTVTPEGMITIK